jgi:hypothetical protein
MGNRTVLSFGTCCGFEANDCLPITWLALFAPQEFRVETRRFEYKKTQLEDTQGSLSKFLTSAKRALKLGRNHIPESDMGLSTEGPLYEECDVAVYQTSQRAALERVEAVIDRLVGQTPVWAYLRPLEILRDELRLCSSDQPVELDVTQFYWAGNQVYRQRVIEGPAAFAGMLTALSGDEARDLALLNQLVSEYSVFATPSVADLHPEDRMFVLIGTYWGEREDLYTLEYFDESYWTIGS